MRGFPVALALAALAACQRGERFDPRGGDVQDPWPRPAPAVRLQQADGAWFDLAAQRGHAVVLFFGYTHCPDVCPTTLSDFVSAKRALGPRAERVRWVFVSVDWDRDHPEEAMRYARAFDPAFIGLGGDSTAIAPVMAGFMVAAFRERADSAGNYAVTHSSQVFVVDPAGQVRRPVRWGEARAQDIRRAVEEALEGT